MLGLLVVVALVGGFFVLSGDSDSSSNGAGDPVAAVNEFYAAALDQDCEKAVDLVSKDSWALITADDNFTDDVSDLPEMTRDEAIAGCEASADESGDALKGTSLASESGNTAIVTTEIGSEESGDYTMDFHVVKEDGGWKIDLAATFEAMMEGFNEEDFELDEDVEDVDPEDFTEEDLDDFQDELDELEEEFGTDYTVPGG